MVNSIVSKLFFFWWYADDAEEFHAGSLGLVSVSVLTSISQVDFIILDFVKQEEKFIKKPQPGHEVKRGK